MTQGIGAACQGGLVADYFMAHYRIAFSPRPRPAG